MIANFSRENLKDDRFSILKDFESNSDVLFLCFSGMGLGGMIPPFEFSGMLRHYDIKKIFVRDIQNYSFHNGLKGLTRNVDETGALIKEIVEESGARRVVSIGNCQGGLGAIMFGGMAGAHKVLAFAPLTFLDRKNKDYYQETRWPEAFERFYKLEGVQFEYFDLLNVPQIDEPETFVYYDVDYTLDRNHSERLEVLPNVQLFTYHGGEHMLIKNLKKSGELEKLLNRFAEQPARYL